MIEIHNYSMAYGDNHLLYNAEASINDGQLAALIGRNGSGKSSLLRAIAGLNNNYTGDIILNEHNIKHMSGSCIAQNLAYVSTERTRISNMRCYDIVATGRAPYTNWIGNLQHKDKAAVELSLKLVGMSAYAERTMDKMSDGECQRVMIARALAQSTPIILLDEPTSFLDMPNRYQLCSLLSDLAHNENKCILFSTHELDIALTMCDSIALIDSPNLHYLPSADMRNSGYIERLFKNDNVSFDASSVTMRMRQ